MFRENSGKTSDEYGPWAWIAGYAIGAVIMALMFSLATGML